MLSRIRRTALPISMVTVVVSTACQGAIEGGGAAFAAREPMAVCEHLDFPFSDWECPDTNETRQFMNLSDVDSISLVVKTKSGAVRITPLNRRVDAIFLGKRTSDTILARFYISNGENAKAAALRNRLTELP